MNFEINFLFLIKPFFLHDQKFKYFENGNNFWDETKKTFFINFHRISVSKIVSDLRF